MGEKKPNSAIIEGGRTLSCSAKRIKKKLRNNFKVNYNYILTMTSNIMMSIVMALLTAAQMTAAEQIKKASARV